MANKKKVRYVSWFCDKRNCLKSNLRGLPEGSIITSDVCENCDQWIYEPLYEEIDLSKLQLED